MWAVAFMLGLDAMPYFMPYDHFWREQQPSALVPVEVTARHSLPMMPSEELQTKSKRKLHLTQLMGVYSDLASKTHAKTTEAATLIMERIQSLQGGVADGANFFPNPKVTTKTQNQNRKEKVAGPGTKTAGRQAKASKSKQKKQSKAHSAKLLGKTLKSQL